MNEDDPMVTELCHQAGRMMSAIIAAGDSSPDPVFGVLEVISVIHRNRPALFEALWDHLQEHTDYEPILEEPEEIARWIVEGPDNDGYDFTPAI